VNPILAHLKSLNVKPNCAPGTYYLVNNYNLGYKANGTLANPTNDPTLFTLPPSLRACRPSAMRSQPKA
jgi:phospholipase C